MLALNIQTLFYKIGASNLEFKQRVDESKGKLSDFEKKTQDNIRTLRNWSAAAGAAATAVVYALNRTVQSTNTAAETVAKLSEQTGVAVENMQGLGYAARQNKSSMEELGQSMVRMTRRTQEAAQGNQAYIASYERIGVSFRNTDGSIKSTENLLLDLADAFAASTDENLKTQVAFNLLGDSGYNLIPLLNQGRGEIIRLAEEANRLGTVLSRENIEKFARYDDALVKFREGMNGVKTQLATAVLPVFTLLGEKAGEGLERFMEWVRENPKLVAQGVVLGGVLTTLGLALGAVALGMTIVSKGVVLVKGLFALLTNPIVWLVALALLLYTAWDENWGGIQEITQTVINAIQTKIGDFKEWWDGSETAKVLKNLWAELEKIWENDETSLIDKVAQTLVAITKALVIQIGGIIWKWGEKKYNSLVDWWNGYTEELFDDDGNLIGTKDHEGFKQKISVFLEANLSENRLYQAVKKGFDEGDWSDFWNVASDVWATGVVIGITLSNLISGIGAAMSAIQSGLGLVAATGASLGVPGLIGLLTIGIQLMEAVSERSYEDFAKNVLAAGLIAAFLYPVTGPGGALAGFNLALNLKLGEGAYDGFIVLFEWIGDSLQKLFSGRWGEFMTLNEFMVDRARKKFDAQVSSEYMENLLKAEKWVRERDPGAEDWDRHVSYTARDWDVDENHLRQLLGMEPLPSVTPTTPTNVEKVPQQTNESVEFEYPTPVGNEYLDHLDRLWEEWERGKSADMPDMTEENIREVIELLTAITGAEVDPELIMLLARLESGAKWGEGVTHVVHPESGAMGPLQSMPISRRDVDNRGGLGGQENLHSWVPGMSLEDNWVAQTEYGIRYIQLLLDRESDKIMRVAEELGISFAEAFFLSYQEGVNALNNAALAGDLTGDLSMVATGHRRTIEEQLTTYHNFTEGGVPIIEQWAEGLLRAKPKITKSVEELTQEAADFMVGGSPPPKGPLSTIDVGGQNVILAWAAGLESALPQVREKVNTIAQTVADFLIGQSPPPRGPLKYIDIGMQNTMEAGMEGARKGLMDGIPTLELAAKEAGESTKEGLFEGLMVGKTLRLTPDGVEFAGEEIADEISGEDSPLYMRVLANVKKLFSSLGDSTMNWLRKQFPELMAEFDDLFKEAELGFDKLTNYIEGITNGTEDLTKTTKQWTDSLSQGLSNAIGYGRGLEETFKSVVNVFDNFLGMLASQFLQIKVFEPLLGITGRGGAEPTNWFANLLASLFSGGAKKGSPGVIGGGSVLSPIMSIMHDGGLILSPAAYYHSGGYIGELKSDEVPIIAQTGERVLSRQQNDQFENLLQNMSTEDGGGMHVDLTINAVDPASFQELLMRNPDVIKHMFIDDFGKNGPMRKILLQLARG